MVRFFHHHIFPSFRRVTAIVLAFVLTMGVLIGGSCSGFADTSFLHLMHMAALTPVSIVHLIPVVLLPMIFSAFAVYIGHSWLIFPLAFLKAFLLGYLTSVIRIFYPDSGVLFAILLLCTEYLTMPILCWFWFRCACDRKLDFQIASGVTLLMLGIGFLDYHVVSPFLVSLLSS